MKNIYEIFDEFEAAPTHAARMKVIENNLSKCLYDVLSMTFHPNCQWLVHGLPDNYKAPTANLPGMSPCQLSTEIRKLYLFQKGDAMAEKLNGTPKQNELLIQLLESLEAREAEVVAGIFRKDQGVEGLTYKFVKQAFPQMLP